MSATAPQPVVPPPEMPKKPRRNHKALLITGGVVAAGACIGIGAAIGSAATKPQTVTHTVTKTVTVTKNVPGPVRTVYKTKDVPVPGPTKYVTKYVPASQGPAGTTIAAYSGTGSQVTGSFAVPASGDYIIKWSYSGNTDPTIGGGTNFSISDTNSSGMPGNEPNDIAVSGQGSTEDTGMSGQQAFNVQATGQWSITVISAS